jgi:toxin ParE1/3/4
MKVQLHARARRDLAEMRDYVLDTVGPDSAERVRSHLRSRIARLGQLPQIRIASSDPEIKILSPAEYPYRIYFTRTVNEVVVLHIRHTARDRSLSDDVG